MLKFKDFDIKPEINHFIGEKIKIERIINIQIVVLDYKIEKSKKKEGTQYMTLQIEKNGEKHVMFTGSTVLMNMIKRVPKEKFPFQSTIVRNNEYYEFS